MAFAAFEHSGVENRGENATSRKRALRMAAANAAGRLAGLQGLHVDFAVLGAAAVGPIPSGRPSRAAGADNRARDARAFLRKKESGRLDEARSR